MFEKTILKVKNEIYAPDIFVNNGYEKVDLAEKYGIKKWEEVHESIKSHKLHLTHNICFEKNGRIVIFAGWESKHGIIMSNDPKYIKAVDITELLI